MSRGHSQPRAKSGRRSLGVCTERDKIDDVVFIDEDTDNFHNVIVIDVPESSQQRLRSSNISRKDKKFPSSGIISIDDDDSPEKDIESGGDLDNYATSSRASRHASSQSQNSEESDGDECQFIQERKFPLKLSKCKRTYSGKTVSKNCFTSNSVYESSSSESESSDCELMEGPIGKIRDQWEKASRRKKAFKDVRNHQSGLEDQASASGSCTDTQTNVEVDNEAEQHKQTPDGSSSSYVGNEKESLSSSTATGGDSPVADLDPTVERESSSWCKTPSQEVQFSQREDDVQNKAKAFPVDSSFSNEEPVSREPSVWSTREHILRGCFQDREENIAGESYSFKTQSGYNSLLNPGKVWFQDEEASLCDTQRSDQTQFDQGKVISVNENEGTRQEPFSCNTQLPNDFIYERANFEEEKSVSGGPSLCSTQPCSGEQVNNGVAFSKDKFGPSPGYFFCDTQLWNDPEISHGTSICQDKEKPVSEESSSYNAQRDETQVNHGRSCFKAEGEPELKSLSNAHLQDEKNSVMHAEKRTGTPDVQNEIISEREKIKETDEYKRAAEQEWASRQRELQIQAEEAQRLKKRKKAETMRLLDMERRQKQRVEEMRETQKKDEETINLKEQLRVQIRKELDRLELMYNDMASLLRGLGIHVGGGIYPMPCEVHAAYKQALLRFHPDRASRTDIRQQVEAEEKFKLISRLKEKFVMTS